MNEVLAIMIFLGLLVMAMEVILLFVVIIFYIKELLDL